MLRVSRKPNGGYEGQFKAKAVELVKAGTRVGMMWISTEKKVHCHVCNQDFTPPNLDPNTKDAWGQCEHCNTPFIFADTFMSSVLKVEQI